MFYDNEMDLAGFFSDFAEQAKQKTSNKKLDIIFKENYVVSNVFNVDIGGTSPTASVKNRDISNTPLKEKDILTIRGIEYVITTIELSGTGISKLKNLH